MAFKNKFEQLFYQALRIRLIEEKIAEIYPTDKIQSPVHLSIGQEHISVGICQALKNSDFVFGTYRGHALYLAKGGELKALFAELYGKVTGCGQGKAGSMHLSDVSVGMMGSSAIVASTISHIFCKEDPRRGRCDHCVHFLYGAGSAKGRTLGKGTSKYPVRNH